MLSENLKTFFKKVKNRLGEITPEDLAKFAAKRAVGAIPIFGPIIKDAINEFSPDEKAELLKELKKLSESQFEEIKVELGVSIHYLQDIQKLTLSIFEELRADHGEIIKREEELKEILLQSIETQRQDVKLKTVVYQAEFHYTKENDKEDLSLIRTLPDGSQDAGPVNLDEITQLEKLSRNFSWNKSPTLSQAIGVKLFNILNGDNQALVTALKEANNYGKTLQVMLSAEGPVSNVPFELLYHTDFLVPSRLHLIRRVSDRGKKKSLTPENRPLKLLFMACSPHEGIDAVLPFEKEEDTIFEVTKDLPIEIDIEDTGSLDGLGERLKTNEYDVVHFTGHADIDKTGNPFFWMETEEGLPAKVTPAQLSDKLRLNPPRLVFLSGCRTGEAPEHAAAMSFAHQLVAEYEVPTVLGWGLPVADEVARFAAQKIYFELSRGKSILDAVLRTRSELFTQHPAQWSLLRLFADSTPLDVPLVEQGQKRRLKPRELQYTFLENSQVKVLKRGFIGRRRHIQRGIKCLKSDQVKVGLLLHGTGGLGKSCLAGKFCDRFKDHALIIVHGTLNAVTFLDALKDGFLRGNDDAGLNTLKIEEKMPDKIKRLCSSAFQQRPYLILLDDFEKNMPKAEEGVFELSPEAVPLLETLLQYLPYCGKMTQLIITSRYTFPLTVNETNLVEQRLESIGLTSFRDADEHKKVSELEHIPYSHPEIQQQLIDAGRGNPRLMEALDTLVGEAEGLDYVSLLAEIKGKQEEFVQELVLRQIMATQSEDFQTVMRRSAVYRLPVFTKGMRSVCSAIKGWQSHVENAVRLSLMEEDSTLRDRLYWVTPLLREELFGELAEGERLACHQSAVIYYQELLSTARDYVPFLAMELIEHALQAGQGDIALEESGDRLLPHLRSTLAYKEALAQGERILPLISTVTRDSTLSKFLLEFGIIQYDIGNARKAIEYYEQALAIDKAVYGDRHPDVATRLNNIGLAWNALGEPGKAIEYYEQALAIDKAVYGDRHPDVATRLNNIGGAWYALGEPRKAIEYLEQALAISKAVYGDRHPTVATRLNNIGGAWNALGEPGKAIEYHEQALSIDKEVYGDRHPNVATDLNNIGGAWNALGEPGKAIEYLEQAYSIFQALFGDEHPNTRTVKEWLDSIRSR